MKKHIIIFAVILLLVFPLLACRKTEESVLTRVTTSHTIRCGYVVYDPYVKKDPNTGQISGLTVDYLEQIAARHGLKIDWTHEVGVDQIVPNINYDRIDMFCVQCSPTPDFLKVLDFAGNMGFLPYYIYVPVNSRLTAGQLKTARFVAADGYIPIVETPKLFPSAKLISFPQTTSPAELYDQLKYGKADALINEDISASNYMRANPGVIRHFSDEPVVIKPMSFPVKKGDTQWVDYINTMMSADRPENRDLFEKLVAKYNISSQALLYTDAPHH